MRLRIVARNFAQAKGAMKAQRVPPAADQAAKQRPERLRKTPAAPKPQAVQDEPRA